MKKFLSISICLMLCLTSLVFFGCEEKPTEVGQVEASEVLTTAMTNMENANAIKMYSNNFMFMGEFLMIASETGTYTEFYGAKSWTKQEGSSWYEYSISSYEYEGVTTTEYIKQLVVSEDGEEEDGDMLSMILSEFEGSEFARATKLNGEFSISFKVVEEGETVTITFKVKDETLNSIVISSGGVSMAINLEFGESVLSEIPEIPTNVEWDVYQPYIEVTGIPTEFVVGDTLNLEEATIEFYEDIQINWPDFYDLTSDMISGFSTDVAGEFTMTITFFGLTYEIDYTVSEPVVE